MDSKEEKKKNRKLSREPDGGSDPSDDEGSDDDDDDDDNLPKTGSNNRESSPARSKKEGAGKSYGPTYKPDDGLMYTEYGTSSDFALFYSDGELEWRAELDHMLLRWWEKADAVAEDYDCFAKNGDYIKIPFDMCKPRSDLEITEEDFQLRFIHTRQNKAKETDDRSDVQDYRNLIFPATPAVVTVPGWKNKSGINCMFCSPFHDKKEIMWSKRCKQVHLHTYEQLSKPGRRYVILDRTLSQRCDKAVEQYPRLRQKFIDEERRAGEDLKVASGRQKVRLVLDYLRTDTILETVYSVKDYYDMKYPGDANLPAFWTRIWAFGATLRRV